MNDKKDIKNKIKSVIVFDASDRNIKLVEASLRNGEVSFLRQGIKKLEEGVIEKGEINNQEAVLKVVLSLLNEVGIKNPETKELIVIIPSSKLFCQTIDIKKGTPEEEQKSILEKLLEIVPVNKNKIDFVYKTAELARVTILRKRKENLKKFFSVAFDKFYIRTWVEIFEKLDLKLKYFEFDFMSQYYALSLSRDKDTTCVIDFGAKNTNISFWNKNDLKYSYTSFWGGDDLSETIKNILGISFVEAEELKKTKGLIEGYEKEEEKNMLLPILEQFLNDLQKSINFYEESYLSSVKKIVLIGGGARLKGIKHFLKTNIKKDCTVERKGLNPNLKTSDRFLNTYGAAYSFLNKKYKTNLLIPVTQNKKFTKNFSNENDFMEYIMALIGRMKSVDFKSSKEKLPFYFTLFFVVLFVGGFALYLIIEGEKNEEFLKRQADSASTSNLIDSQEKPQEKPQEKKEEEKYIMVKPLDLSLRIRAGAGTSFAVVGKTEGGEKHLLLDETSEWVKIEFEEDSSGWVSKAFIDFLSEE